MPFDLNPNSLTVTDVLLFHVNLILNGGVLFWTVNQTKSLAHESPGRELILPLFSCPSIKSRCQCQSRLCFYSTSIYSKMTSFCFSCQSARSCCQWRTWTCVYTTPTCCVKYTTICHRQRRKRARTGSNGICFLYMYAFLTLSRLFYGGHSTFINIFFQLRIISVLLCPVLSCLVLSCTVLYCTVLFLMLFIDVYIVVLPPAWRPTNIRPGRQQPDGRRHRLRVKNHPASNGTKHIVVKMKGSVTWFACSFMMTIMHHHKRSVQYTFVYVNNLKNYEKPRK